MSLEIRPPPSMSSRDPYASEIDALEVFVGEWRMKAGVDGIPPAHDDARVVFEWLMRRVRLSGRSEAARAYPAIGTAAGVAVDATGTPLIGQSVLMPIGYLVVR